MFLRFNSSFQEEENRKQWLKKQDELMEKMRSQSRSASFLFMLEDLERRRASMTRRQYELERKKIEEKEKEEMEKQKLMRIMGEDETSDEESLLNLVGQWSSSK